MTNHLGYACINMTLSSGSKKDRVTTNRGMIKRTFLAKGKDYASELALQNCKDLKKILEWNARNNISFFRLSSEIFPWCSEYEIESLKDYEEIEEVMFDCGLFIEDNNMRITSHPGPFNKLASFDERISSNTIRDLENHGKVFDLLCLSHSTFNKINIHVGAVYDGSKEKTCDNFCRNFEKLSDGVKSRLTVENDDKPSLYSALDLKELISDKIEIPVVFDYHHHKFCSSGMSERDALFLSLETWGDVKPVVHYSQSRSFEHNDSKIKENAHSDSYWTPIDFYGKEFDVMLEAKHKELALFKMRELLTTKKENV